MAGHVALVSTAVVGGTGRQNAKRNLVSGQRKWEDELREQGENLRKGSWNRESPEVVCVCVHTRVPPHKSWFYCPAVRARPRAAEYRL